MDKFELAEEDWRGVRAAINVARLFLKSPAIQPQQVIGLGNALYALERLPLITDGSCSEFGISFSEGTREFNELIY